jgi:hypothetical protein
MAVLIVVTESATRVKASEKLSAGYAGQGRLSAGPDRFPSRPCQHQSTDDEGYSDLGGLLEQGNQTHRQTEKTKQESAGLRAACH